MGVVPDGHAPRRFVGPAGRTIPNNALIAYAPGREEAAGH